MVAVEYQTDTTGDTDVRYRVLFRYGYPTTCSCNPQGGQQCLHIIDAESKFSSSDPDFRRKFESEELFIHEGVQRVQKIVVERFQFQETTNFGQTIDCEVTLWNDGTKTCNCSALAGVCNHIRQIEETLRNHGIADSMERISRASFARPQPETRNVHTARFTIRGPSLSIGDYVKRVEGGISRAERSDESQIIGVCLSVNDSNREAIVELHRFQNSGFISAEQLQIIANGLPLPPRPIEVPAPEPQPTGHCESMFFPNHDSETGGYRGQHEVKIYGSGATTCTCNEWKSSGKNYTVRNCIHTLEVKITANKMRSLVAPKPSPAEIKTKTRYLNLED